MSLQKWFRYPFGIGGDRAAIPDATQPSGAVSYQQAYGPQYELPYDDANARDIERTQNNQLHYDITTALQEYQTNGVPDWIEPSQNGGVNYAYPLGARVRYSDGKIYVSQKAANSSLPTVVADWTEESGRLLRTTRFTLVGGVQNVSVNGGANTTVGAGTFTRLPGTKFARVRAQGAGSGGAGATAPAGGFVTLGAPGCAGSYLESIFTAAELGTSHAVVVGAASAGSSGAVGGSSSVGALATAPGGSAAGQLASQTPPTLNGNGNLAAAPTGANIVSIRGAAPNLTVAQSATVGQGGAGGPSVFGAGGNGPAMNVNGTNASNYGAGGSGVLVNSGGGTATAGAGGDGIVIYEEYGQ